MSNPWAPNESASQIYAEKTFLQGALLSNIFYGIELTLFAICFKILWQQTNRSNYKRHTFLLGFITVLFILGTIFVYSLAEFTQLAFIEDRNYPGGPAAYEEEMFWIPVDELGVVVFVMGNWLMDALLVWRCRVIFSNISGLWTWAVMTLPCILYLASFSLGVLFLAKTSRSSPFLAVDVSLAYFSTTLALNIIVTILIVVRLLLWRRQFSRVLGPTHASYYADLSAVLVESASLYSLFVIMFIVPLALNNPLSSVFLQTMGQVQTVSSLLIIFRVATGRGWTEGTSVQITTPLSSNPIRLRELSSFRDPSSGSEAGVYKGGVVVTKEIVSDQKSTVSVV